MPDNVFLLQCLVSGAHFLIFVLYYIILFLCIFYCRGLYGGIGIHLMRSVPNAAVMFVTFEVASKWLLAQQLKQNNALIALEMEKEKEKENILGISESGKKRKFLQKSVAMVTPINFKINKSFASRF